MYCYLGKLSLVAIAFIPLLVPLIGIVVHHSHLWQPQSQGCLNAPLTLYSLGLPQKVMAMTLQMSRDGSQTLRPCLADLLSLLRWTASAAWICRTACWWAHSSGTAVGVAVVCSSVAFSQFANESSTSISGGVYTVLRSLCAKRVACWGIRQPGCGNLVSFTCQHGPDYGEAMDSPSIK